MQGGGRARGSATRPSTKATARAPPRQLTSRSSPRDVFPVRASRTRGRTQAASAPPSQVPSAVVSQAACLVPVVRLVQRPHQGLHRAGERPQREDETDGGHRTPVLACCSVRRRRASLTSVSASRGMTLESRSTTLETASGPAKRLNAPPPRRAAGMGSRGRRSRRAPRRGS